MNINYSVPRKYTFSMEKYTRNIINKFPEDLGEAAETPAGETLFTIHDDDTLRPLLKHQEPYPLVGSHTVYRSP